MTILFNGSTGGLGRHVGAVAAARNLASMALRSRLEDEDGLETELRELAADSEVAFIHLAAMVSVPACEAKPELAERTNVILPVRALTAVHHAAGHLRVVYVSTGHVYAAPTPGTLVDEDADLGPRSVYARTKLEGEATFAAYCEKFGIPLLIARVFGLLAPGQPAHYVLPALIDRARDDRLEGIPGLDFTRDYLDARDVAASLVDLAGAQATGTTIINVCSGEGVRIRDLLEHVLAILNPRDAQERARGATSAPGRPDDVPWLVGDPGRYGTVMGRNPKSTPLPQTVADAIRARPTRGLETEDAARR